MAVAGLCLPLSGLDQLVQSVNQLAGIVDCLRSAPFGVARVGGVQRRDRRGAECAGGKQRGDSFYDIPLCMIEHDVRMR